MKYHPDRNAWNKNSEAKFKEINEAYSILSNDSKRQQYDTFWTANWAWWFWWWASWFNVDVDLWDIFSSFFGWWAWNNTWTNSGVMKWEDLEYNMRIDLKTSIFGWKQNITFNKEAYCQKCEWKWWSGESSCSKCNWTWTLTYTQQSIFWTIQQKWVCDKCNWSWEWFEKICDICRATKRNRIKKDIEIDIPAGIDSWMVIKLTWEWNDWIWTKASWDLYVKFSVILEEKWLERESVDLYYNIEIDVIEAILWTKKDINIPILGKRQIEIKSWTNDSSIIKIIWDWVKHIDSERKWNLFIKLNVIIAKKITRIERELYEEIAKEKKINVNNKKWIFESFFS